MTKARNLLVIMSDEHNPKIAGYAGDTVVATPHLDRLAARGTRFDAAYTPSPICVPARGAFATGQPVHRSRCWDNAIAYDGRMPSWHKALRDRGHHVASIGKLHFEGHPGQDYGFSEMILPMQITNGTGDVTMLLRDPTDVREAGARKLLAQSGPGESEYSIYDRRVAAAAQTWLRESAPRHTDKPWVLFVSMVSPHFPLTAPPEHYYRYADRDLPKPKLWDAPVEERLPHPWLRGYGHRSDHYRHFRSDDDLHRALAGYYGLVSFMDDHVGKILAALEAAGITDDTRVIYTSDHGDNLGSRGLWGKCTMYEESARIPLLMAGPDVPAATACPTPVTLCDVAATILDAVGAADAITELALPGESLLALAGAPPKDKAALSQLHTYCPNGVFMLRTLRHKYIHYVGAAPQLFDLEADPEELHDLAGDPAHAALLAALEARLRAMLDPETVDAEAIAAQSRKIDEYGGTERISQKERMAYTPPPVG
ncbi:sulfatase-like hydrolase/transferase [Roseomonas terrae]|uniref:Sulfatase-like hydrolase/transferase n=1 Tax=Neoroseomonas terrae TaxID=424799 RepID=A0ABS5ELW3_9PROT|nr:sulfatase-like hydrolase/transferase [Neoroseomonas terrae]MBR0652021.1 sulfatase-like hydrolase/transferase [Neoroseomonas terrae]